MLLEAKYSYKRTFDQLLHSLQIISKNSIGMEGIMKEKFNEKLLSCSIHNQTYKT